MILRGTQIGHRLSEVMGQGQPFTGPLGDEIAFDFGEQGKQGGHDLGLEILTVLEADFLLDGDEGDRCLGDCADDPLIMGSSRVGCEILRLGTATDPLYAYVEEFADGP